MALQVTIQICQPHSKLKILSRRSLFCGSCVMMLSLDSESANLSLLQQKAHRKRQRDTPVFFTIFSAGYVVLFFFFLLLVFMCLKQTRHLSQLACDMAGCSCFGTNTPWWTPAGRCASRGSPVIIFILLISQIEMDTYDKNVTATPHVSGLTGLHVTFQCLALFSSCREWPHYCTQELCGNIW